jgi:hypothetical protein
MNMRIIIFLLLTGVCGMNANAQDSTSRSLPYKRMLGIGWNISTPLNNLGFISRTDPEGGYLAYQFFLPKRFSAGADVSWSSAFQYKSRKTYYFEDGALTTDRINVLHELPIALRGKYYYFSSPHVMGYAGLGLGALYSEAEIYFSIFHDFNSSWGFLASPEAGFIFMPRFYGAFGIVTGVQYNYATNRFAPEDIKNLQSLQVMIGLAFLR